MPNELIHEKSPYLLQHADNPVNWYPWGEKAFSLAREQNKPVFLSIGYSTCHWCHVMEKESFVDTQVAVLLNNSFIAIKVDREERPDIDSVYMSVCQMLTGSGGWPLTLILTPDKKPFFAATYIPKTSRYGRKGLMELLPEITGLWQKKPGIVEKAVIEIMEHLQTKSIETLAASLNTREIMDRAFYTLSRTFDNTNGGFGSAPKFPTPHRLLFLLRYYNAAKQEHALTMVDKTCTEMRMGGIYDHIGFGFHRYATDAKWQIPHFEKMLYDQAMLIMIYTQAFQVTGNILYKNTVHEICQYIVRDMTAPKGGFYSAEDADSDGKEGSFYVWDFDELEKILTKEELLLAQGYYHISKQGNFTSPEDNLAQNILYCNKSIPQFADELEMPESMVIDILEQLRQKLYHIRLHRNAPYKDDKILTDWNGLLITALAQAGRVFNDDTLVTAACNAADFIQRNLYNNNRLLHRYKDNEAAIPGFLDDYAFLAWGLLELYQADFNPRHLQNALELTKTMITLFWADVNGGFYSTGSDAEMLLIRKKEYYDGAIPSGNSVAGYVLAKLGRMLMNQEYETKAAQCFSSVWTDIENLPEAHTFLLCALDFSATPGTEIIICGDKNADETKKMLSVINKHYLPSTIVLFRPEEQSAIDYLAPFIVNYSSGKGHTAAYICQNYQCEMPVTTAKELEKKLLPKNSDKD